TLAYLNNLGCIDMNPWNSRYTKLDYPDYLVLDLDPSDKNTFNHIIKSDFIIRVSRYTKLDYPDYLVIDFDPSDKNNFNDVIEVAQQINELLDEIKIEGYCKTSGSTGLHIYIPMGGKYHYDQVKDFAHILMSHTLDRLPEITTLERSLKKR